MPENLQITDVKYSPASEREGRDGLLGFVAFDVDCTLRVESVMVRRTRNGDIRLSFPRRRLDPTGQEQFFVRPVNDAARRYIESQILSALGYEEAAR